MESCLVYDHLLDHTSSVIYRHCSSHTIVEQGTEVKTGDQRRRACIVYCLILSSYGLTWLLTGWLGLCFIHLE